MNSGGSPRSDRELRIFGLTTGGMAAFIFGLALPWIFNRPFPVWPWIVAGALWSGALALPAALRPVFRIWMTLGHWLGWINTRIILGIVFYTVFFLVGLVMKLMGKDPMARKIDKTVESYRSPSHARAKDHVQRPF